MNAPPETPVPHGPDDEALATKLFAPSKNNTTAFLPNSNDEHAMGAPSSSASSKEDREPSLAGSSNSASDGSRLSPFRSSSAEADESTDDMVSAVTAAAPESPISAEEQARRDEQASIELARAMMEEEAMASYAVSYEISMDYLRNHQNQFSQEDLAALEAAMEEENAAAAEDGEDDNGMSYDMMLRLGEQIGDVKLERWARVAHQKIDALPTSIFDSEKIDEKSANDCDIKCLICQCQYEQGEKLRTLPCGHVFHAETCVDQWLRSKDFCPYCRTSLAEES